MSFTEREQLVEKLNRLFYYTDYQIWDKLKAEVFADEVKMDMTSLGAPSIETWSAQRICDEWTNGFKDLDAIHHQAGTFIIDINGSVATAKAYAIASHYKKDATNGTSREFIGSYDIHFTKIENSWKLDALTFNLKYMKGNLELT